MIGVAWSGSRDSMRSFEERHGLTFPSLYDADGALFARFGVPYQPAWVFLRPDGSGERVSGALSESELADTLDELAAS